MSPSCVRCLLCESMIATSGPKYEEHLQDWHNVTVQRMVNELMWMSSYDEDISENQEVERRQEEEAVEDNLEVQEDVGKYLQEKSGEKHSEEDHSSSSCLPSIKFNPQCVVQSGSGKVHKFLHIDQSIGGNPITIKGQSLLVLPDAISTQVPDCSTQEETQRPMVESYGKLKGRNIAETRKKANMTGEEKKKKLRIAEDKIQIHKTKKKYKIRNAVNCLHCGLNLCSKRNLAKHIERFHNPTRPKETKKFLEGDFKCLEVGCDGNFKYRETLVAHQRNKHGAPMLKCLYQGCGMQFSWANCLRNHMKKHKI